MSTDPTNADPVLDYLANHDVACPGCGYNLRGLHTKACPECSRSFTADDPPHASEQPAVSPSLVAALGVELALVSGFLAFLSPFWTRPRDAYLSPVCPILLLVLFALLMGISAINSRRWKDERVRRKEHASAAWLGVALTALAIGMFVLLSLH